MKRTKNPQGARGRALALPLLYLADVSPDAPPGSTLVPRSPRHRGRAR